MDRVKKIAEYYGIETQLDQLIEEMGELIQAISKFRRVNGRGAPIRGALSYSEALGNVIKEGEDVRICLDELIHLFSAAEVANDIRNYKLDRTIKEIERAKNENSML